MPNYKLILQYDGSRYRGWQRLADSDMTVQGKVEAVLEQTEDSFIEQVNAFVTKRDLDTLYKINSGTWAQEVDIFEDFFAGMTVEELRAILF